MGRTWATEEQLVFLEPWFQRYLRHYRGQTANSGPFWTSLAVNFNRHWPVDCQQMQAFYRHTSNRYPPSTITDEDIENAGSELDKERLSNRRTLDGAVRAQQLRFKLINVSTYIVSLMRAGYLLRSVRRDSCIISKTRLAKRTRCCQLRGGGDLRKAGDRDMGNVLDVFSRP